MIGYRFTKYLPPASKKGDFDQLLKLFTELLVVTSGEVSEALHWLTNIDKKYNLTNSDYGIGDFIEDLKKQGYLNENPVTGKFDVSAKSEQFIRKQALEEIFGKLKKGTKGDHRTVYTGLGEEPGSDRRKFEFIRFVNQKF